MINNYVYTIVSIADIHFGCNESPIYMYEQLKLQFTSKISNIDFQILTICGDLFDSRFMGNNPAITYAIQFIDDLVQLCTIKNASLIILAGTLSHDSGQLSLFYHYMNRPDVDVRIVEKIQFENIKNLRVSSSDKFSKLFSSSFFSSSLSNKGSFKGSEIATLNTTHAPIFGINYFENCAGPILMGHYHIPGSYDGYAYYNGSAFRYKFGEEEEKGFLVTLYNPYFRTHYTELIPIKSHIYATININHLLNEDPRKIIEWIKYQKESNKIDFIRVQFNNANENINIVRNYFKTNGYIKLQELDKKEKQLEKLDQEMLEKNQQYSYIIDTNISDYDKFIMYINQNEGYDYITSDELIKLLEGDM